MDNQIGKQVIVRADKAGVFYGTLSAKNGLEVQLKNARKLFYWSGANAVEQIASEGIKYPEQSKFTVVVEEITISNYIQILTCTKIASDNINSVKEWKAL